jgi:hypothetical protein
LFILDEWTAVAPGNVPRAFLSGRGDATFLLAFFGLGPGVAQRVAGVPDRNVLSAFPSVRGAGRFLG